MGRNIEGHPTIASLDAIALDLFDDMTELTYVHLAQHPKLQSLPSLEGSTNLKSLSLVGFEMVTEIPSLRTLERLERLELLQLPKLAQLPDLSAQRQLVHFVVKESAVCCNGFVGMCGLSTGVCQSDEASCVDSIVVANRSQQTTKLLKQFNSTLCPAAQTPPASCSGIVSPEAGAEMCGGILYRQCSPQTAQSTGNSSSSSGSWMCYNSQMQVITCTCSPANIAVRKLEIQKGLGGTCDPVEEQWLGCR